MARSGKTDSQQPPPDGAAVLPDPVVADPAIAADDGQPGLDAVERTASESPRFESPRFESPRFESPPFESPPSESLPSESPPSESPGPELPTPDLPTPELPTPDLPTPELPTPDLPMPELSAPELPTPDLPTPELPTPDLLESDILARVLPGQAAETEPLPPLSPPVPTESPVLSRESPPPQIVQRGGFVPLLLGGLVAGGIGFAGAWTTFRPDDAEMTAVLTAQAARLAALETVEAPVVDLSPVTAALAQAEAAQAAEQQARAAGLNALGEQMTGDLAGIGATLTTLQDRTAAIDIRLSALERAPAADGTLPQAAIAAWQSDIAALQAAVADLDRRLTGTGDGMAARVGALEQALAATMQDAAAQAAEVQARLDAAQTAAITVEADAVAATALATRRAAMSSLLAALDAGTPFDGALDELTASGLTAPDALTLLAADGVPAAVALVESFPDAARTALVIARAEGLADAEGNRFVAFLRSQFNVRSVTPQAGSDPDAILSRAEAAVREGRLNDALTEIAALPEVVRAALAGWTSGARARGDAVAAAQALSETLNMN